MLVAAHCYELYKYRTLTFDPSNSEIQIEIACAHAEYGLCNCQMFVRHELTPELSI